MNSQIKRLLPFLLLVAASCSAQQKANISGSDTLILLGQRLSQLYRRDHPDFQMTIRGGGETQALSALPSGDVNIVQAGGALGSRANGLFTFPVGVQGLVVYVNKTNPINELTVAQVREIFLGKITNWRPLGGADRAIALYAGESSTGNLDFFQQFVLNGEEPYPFVGKSSAKELLDVIAGDVNAIGYSSFAQNPQVKALRIKAGAASVAVEPTIANIRSRQYPISRPIYWLLARKPSQGLNTFCQWVLSSEGQLVVESVGFEPVSVESRNKELARLSSALPSTSVSVH